MSEVQPKVSIQQLAQEAGRTARTVTGFSDAKLLDNLRPQQSARTLWEIRPSVGPSWRSCRSHLLSLSVVPSVQDDEVGSGVLLEGFLKGRPLNVNSLVHVLGVGVARIKSIAASWTEGPELTADPSK